MAVGLYTLGVAAFAALGTFFFGFDTVSLLEMEDGLQHSA